MVPWDPLMLRPRPLFGPVVLLEKMTISPAVVGLPVGTVVATGTPITPAALAP